MSTAIVTIAEAQKNALTNYTGKLFADIDFDSLNQIITRIAENKETLTDGMRQAASEYAQKWDDIVVERLEYKRSRLNDLLNFLSSEHNVSYYTIENLIKGPAHWDGNNYVQNDEVFTAIVNLFESKESWKAYAAELQEIKTEYENINDMDLERPDIDDYVIDPDNMTFNDRLVAQKEFELEKAKYAVKERKAQNALRIKYAKLMKRVQRDKSICDFVENLKAQVRLAKRMTSVVHEKSSLVAMSVNFSGTDLLSALQELHDFQKQL